MSDQLSMFRPGGRLASETLAGHPVDDSPPTLADYERIWKQQRTPKRPKLTQNEMVLAIIGDGQWWTPVTLRQAIRDRYGVHVEAVTSRIRELRQHGLTVVSEKVKGRPEHRYRLEQA